ncbi:uncharacterized protein LOC132903972 [Amyelois transitella]|uniref:uncharacterized protein LOC132903972 n=1 Tax=Amyelois transitella TaxID=680683 RepID=UPI00299063BB|nr:uncharacterized protein LOC132903972 [Amyelois transitella]
MVSADEPSDTEDDEIRQALFLVHLLKSDYAKIFLRQNSEAPAENLSTCPLTTENSSLIASSTPSLTTKGIFLSTTTPQPVESSTIPLFKLAILTTQLPTLGPLPFGGFAPMSKDISMDAQDYPAYFKSKRRNLMYRRRGNLMRYKNFRRMSSNDKDNNLPASNSESSSLKASISTNALATSSKIPPSSAHVSSLIRSTTNARVISGKNMRNDKLDIVTQDEVMPQIARELYNELKEGDLTMKPSTRGRLRTISIKSKLSALVKTYADTFKKKGTLKVYLDHSTPLPIPFPENNAFCFMNPRSSLCGTKI